MTRRVDVLVPTVPAVVLGSTQADVDHEAAAEHGLTVVRRRSGGGAVLVAPDDPLWVDVDLPAGDPLGDDDVGRSFLWLGRAWAAALRAHGFDATVHEGRFEPGPWGRAVCFAGRGPGEVFVDGAKAVGIAQRRTRSGARFQCAVPRRWDPRPLTDLVAPGADLAAVARPVAVAPDVLVVSLLDALPGS